MLGVERRNLFTKYGFPTKRKWYRPTVKHVGCVYKITCEQRMNDYFG